MRCTPLQTEETQETRKEHEHSKQQSQTTTDGKTAKAPGTEEENVGTQNAKFAEPQLTQRQQDSQPNSTGTQTQRHKREGTNDEMPRERSERSDDQRSCEAARRL
jgi:hypothetical protein